MNSAHWALIGLLALAALSLRLLGLFAGDRIRQSRQAWILQDLPGLILISLVAAALAGQPWQAWVAAGVALAAAQLSGHVILTMLCGMATYAVLISGGI